MKRICPNCQAEFDSGECGINCPRCNSDKLDQAREEEREKLRGSVIKIHDEVGEEWSDAEYRSNYMSTLLISLQDNPKCVCGEQDIIGGAEVEIGGVCHRPKNPCYIIEPLKNK